MVWAARESSLWSRVSLGSSSRFRVRSRDSLRDLGRESRSQGRESGGVGLLLQLALPQLEGGVGEGG